MLRSAIDRYWGGILGLRNNMDKESIELGKARAYLDNGSFVPLGWNIKYPQEKIMHVGWRTCCSQYNLSILNKKD